MSGTSDNSIMKQRINSGISGFIKNLKMTKKIFIIPGISIIMISLLLIILFIGMVKQKGLVDYVVNNIMKEYQLNLALSKDFFVINSNVYKALVWKSSGYDDQDVKKVLEQQTENADKLIEKFKKIKINENSEYYKEMNELLEGYQFNIKMTTVHLLSGDVATASMTFGSGDFRTNKFYERSEKFLKDMEIKSNELVRKSTINFLSFMFFVGVLSAGTIVFIIILSIYITRVIVKPIKDTVEILKDISDGDGDLTKKLVVNTGDEIGEFAGLFNNFIQKIREVVAKVHEISVQLTASSQDLSESTGSFSENAQGQAASSEEITASTEEIQANISIIAEGSSEQYDSVVSLIDRIEQLSAIIKSMDIKIGESSNLSESMYSEVRSREQSLKYMSESMVNINKSSMEMTNIINIINDISEKINLLSLNAAIEAARAGDAGRGFAVVADEISKLADQTAQSLKDIGSLIKTSESEIKRGIENVNETLDTITNVINGVNSISDMMKNIKAEMIKQKEINEDVITEVSTVGRRSEEIKLSIDEQKIAMREIMSSITNISDLTQNNSAGAEEIAASASNLKELAKVQNELVDFFKV